VANESVGDWLGFRLSVDSWIVIVALFDGFGVLDPQITEQVVLLESDAAAMREEQER
jgi:hypothetical protein